MLLCPLNASSDSILPEGGGGGLPSIDLRGFAAGKNGKKVGRVAIECASCVLATSPHFPESWTTCAPTGISTLLGTLLVASD